MSEHIPDRGPDGSAGQGPVEGARPGETPPAEGGLSGTGPRETYNPVKGWAAAPITLLTVVVILFIGFFAAYAAILLFD
jgi:hypothetical protein